MEEIKYVNAVFFPYTQANSQLEEQHIKKVKVPLERHKLVKITFNKCKVMECLKTGRINKIKVSGYIYHDVMMSLFPRC